MKHLLVTGPSILAFFLICTSAYLIKFSHLPQKEKVFYLKILYAFISFTVISGISFVMSLMNTQSSIQQLGFYISLCITFAYSFIFIPFLVLWLTPTPRKRIRRITLSIFLICFTVCAGVVLSHRPLGLIFLSFFIVPFLILWAFLTFVSMQQTLSKSYLYFHFFTALITFGLFYFDCSYPQNDPNSTIYPSNTIRFLSVFYITIIYITYVLCLLSLLKIQKQLFEIEFKNGLLILTLISCLTFSFIWWCFFYTSSSLPRRIYGWTTITLVFPWLPILFSHYWQKIHIKHTLLKPI